MAAIPVPSTVNRDKYTSIARVDPDGLVVMVTHIKVELVSVNAARAGTSNIAAVLGYKKC